MNNEKNKIDVINYFDDESKIDFFIHCPKCGSEVIPRGDYLLDENDKNIGLKHFSSYCDHCSLVFLKFEEMTEEEYKYCRDNNLFGETFCPCCYPDFINDVKNK